MPLLFLCVLLYREIEERIWVGFGVDVVVPPFALVKRHARAEHCVAQYGAVLLLLRGETGRAVVGAGIHIIEY